MKQALRSPPRAKPNSKALRRLPASASGRSTPSPLSLLVRNLTLPIPYTSNVLFPYLPSHRPPPSSNTPFKPHHGHPPPLHPHPHLPLRPPMDPLLPPRRHGLGFHNPLHPPRRPAPQTHRPPFPSETRVLAQQERGELGTDEGPGSVFRGHGFA